MNSEFQSAVSQYASKAGASPSSSSEKKTREELQASLIADYGAERTPLVVEAAAVPKVTETEKKEKKTVDVPVVSQVDLSAREIERLRD